MADTTVEFKLKSNAAEAARESITSTQQVINKVKELK